MAIGQIDCNCLQKAWRLHRRDEVIEKTLLVALEGAPRRRLRARVQRAFGACNVGGFEGSRQVLMDDL